MFRRYAGPTALYFCACFVLFIYAPPISAVPIFGPPLAISPSNYSPVGIQRRDLNGDHLEDILFSSPGDLVAELSQGDGTFSVVADTNGLTLASPGLFVEDLNHDNKVDIVGLDTNGVQVETSLGQGDGHFKRTYKPISLSSFSPFSLAMVIGDFNKDSNLDLVMATETNADVTSLSVFLGDGDGGFGSRRDFAKFKMPNAITVADFDLDKNLDIAIGNNGSTITTLLGNGDGTFRSSSDYEIGDYHSEIVWSDFNNDGKPDLAATSSPSSGDFGSVDVLIGNGDGSFRTAQTMPADRTPTGIITGDFNSDHSVDLAVANQNSATVGIYLGNGDGTFQPPQYYPAGGNASFLVGADFDQDGRTDLAVMSITQINLLLNKYVPPLLLKPNPPVTGAGKPVTVTLTAPRPLATAPTATLTGNCVDEQKLDFAPTEQADTYSTTVTLPNSGPDCSLTVNAQGTYIRDNAPTDGSTLLQLDVTPPVTSLPTLPKGDNDHVLGYFPFVIMDAVDAVAGVDKTYYALDQPECKPDALANCSVYTQPFTIKGDGSHTITFFSQDKVGNMEAAQSYTLKINSTVPQVTDREVSLDEDTSTEILLTATDAGNDPLTIKIVQPPAHGELKLLEGTRYLYTPNPQYFGPDGFFYRASDGVNVSKSGTISISVKPFNDPPVAASFQVSTLGEQPLPLQLQAIDVDHDPLTYTIVTPPSNGILKGMPPDLTYLSNPGLSRKDSFTYVVSDGSSESGLATVSIAITPPLVVIGSGTAAPGETVSMPISVTGAMANVAGLDLTFQGSGPSGRPLPPPTFSSTPPNAWQVHTDPNNPWHVTLFRVTGIAGPAEVATLSFVTAATDPLDAVYRIEPQSIVLFDEMGAKIVATHRTVPGEATVIACSEAVKGDLTGDGKISVADVTALLRIAVGISTSLSSCDRHAADVNCDGEINLGDAILTLRSALFGESLVCRE